MVKERLGIEASGYAAAHNVVSWAQRLVHLNTTFVMPEAEGHPVSIGSRNPGETESNRLKKMDTAWPSASGMTR
jgi:hypothetical protein